MAKVKFDLRNTDPDEAKRGSSEPPQPGVYKVKIKECEAGFSKGDDGKPDKTRPRVEVVFEVTEGKHRGYPLWYYLTFQPEGYPAVKLDQFLQVMGLASDKKRTGEFDTVKMVGKVCNVRLRKGKDQDGNYRPEVGSVLPLEDDDEGLTDDDDIVDDDDETIVDEDEELVEEDDWDARLEELKAMSADDIKTIAKEWKDAGWDIKISGTKPALAAAIVEVEKAAADGDEGETGEDEEILEDEEEILEDEDEEILEDEEGGDYLTEEILKAADNDQLKQYAKDFDVAIKGLTKSKIIAAILEAQGVDEPPF